MLLKDLKKQIEDGVVSSDMIIFIVSDNNFVAKQYIRAIAKLHNKDISNVDAMPKKSIDIFMCDCFSADDVKVFETDKLEEVINQENLYIITKKVSDEIKDKYGGYIVSIPKLENWQVKDYVYSLAEGVDEGYLEQLCEMCHYDIYRLNSEVSKLKTFSDKERNILFKQMIDDNAYNDISRHNMFDLTNAIVRRDLETIDKIYKQLDSIDCEPIGLVTTLYNNFKNVANIQLDTLATASTYGMSDKQFWAIKKYSCGFYSGKQLIKILEFLTSVDKMIKTGEIFTDRRLTDYVVCHIINI